MYTHQTRSLEHVSAASPYIITTIHYHRANEIPQPKNILKRYFISLFEAHQRDDTHGVRADFNTC